MAPLSAPSAEVQGVDIHYGRGRRYRHLFCVKVVLCSPPGALRAPVSGHLSLATELLSLASRTKAIVMVLLLFVRALLDHLLLHAVPVSPPSARRATLPGVAQDALVVVRLR